MSKINLNKRKRKI